MFVGRKSRPMGIATLGKVAKPTLVANAKSIDFDGTNDGIILPASNLLITGTNVTYACWAKTTDTDRTYLFGNQKGAGSTNMSLSINANGGTETAGVITGFTWNGSSHDNVVYDGNVDDSAWHHYAFTTSSSAQVLYLDGVAVATGTNTFSNSASSNSMTIGSLNHVNYFLQGNMDEVAIWSRVLKASEIADIYNSKRMDLSQSSLSYSANNLVAWYRMGDGTLDEYPLIADQTNATLGSEELTNNGFESGLTLAASWTNMDGWVDETVLSSQNANATLDTSNARTGSNCMKMELLSGGSYLNYGLTSLAAGVYRFSIFFRAGDSQTITSIRLGAATGLRGFALGDSGTVYSISETYSEVVAYINNPSSQNVRFTINAGGTNNHFLFIDDISIKKVNGNPGIMTNMASGDIETDVPT